MVGKGMRRHTPVGKRLSPEIVEDNPQAAPKIRMTRTVPARRPREDPHLPRRIGEVGRTPVYSCFGPVPSIQTRADNASGLRLPLVLDSRTQLVRALGEAELWQLQGGSPDSVVHDASYKDPRSGFWRAVARGTPPKLARNVLDFVLEDPEAVQAAEEPQAQARMHDPEDTRCGFLAEDAGGFFDLPTAGNFWIWLL